MKSYLIDLDGTMYRGNENIDGAREFIAWCIAKQQPFYFLTNNATRTRLENVQHMEKLGFKGIREDQFFTSSMAAARTMQKLSTKRNAYMIGQAGLREALLDAGFKLVEEDVDFVFVGLDANADYESYSKALSYLVNGAKLVGTNNDRKLPHGKGYKLGNGSIVAMFEYASEQQSPKIGKPYPPILNEALEYFNIRKEDAICIGDNLETDILLGVNCQVETIFVTTGVHTFADIERFQIVPTHKIHSLYELISE